MKIPWLLVLTLLLAGRPAAAELFESEPGIRLHLERIGTGPQVVIVPGGFLHGEDLRRLARRNRTVLLYDMRNRGRSSHVSDDSRISIEADVADLEAVRRHVGARRVSLIGYSYLGMMVMLYAVRHPDHVDRVVQLGPVPMEFRAPLPRDLIWDDPFPIIPASETAALTRSQQRGLDRSHPYQFCLRSNRVSRRELVVDPRNALRIDYRRRCAMRNEWPVNFQHHLSIHFAGSIQNMVPPRDQFRRLQTPVLTIHGTMDRNAPFAGGVEWVMTLPNARLIIARRAAHNVWLDHPAAYAEADQFLGGNWPASAIRVTSWNDARARLPGGLSH